MCCILGEDVALLVALELRRPEILQGLGFGFGGAYILPGLVETTLWSFDSFRIKLLHIMRSEEWPTNKVSCLDRLEPCRFSWVAIYYVHPLECLFGER